MPVNFKELFSTLKTGILSLAKTSFSDYLNDAVADGNSIIDDLKTNIESWSQLLADGDIDEDNFKSLIQGQKDLLEMMALTEAGMTEIQIDKFKNGVFDLITNAVMGLVSVK